MRAEGGRGDAPRKTFRRLVRGSSPPPLRFLGKIPKTEQMLTETRCTATKRDGRGKPPITHRGSMRTITGNENKHKSSLQTDHKHTPCPNSFCSTAMRLPRLLQRMWRKKVLFPEPRKPVMMVTGHLDAILQVGMESVHERATRGRHRQQRSNSSRLNAASYSAAAAVGPPKFRANRLRRKWKQ